MGNNKLKKILFIIFIFALFLRLIAVFSQQESKKLPLADAKDYDNIAVSIISGHGFSRDLGGTKAPTTFRPPLFPLFLAGVYAIFGHSYIAVKIVQAVLGALFCIMIFFIADIVFGNKKIGTIASILTALYKPFAFGFYYYGGPAVLYSEYFYMFMLGSVVLMTLFFIKKENKCSGILSGVFIGLTMLTRPEFALYVILLFCYLYVRGHKTVPFRVRMERGRSVFRSKKPQALARGASFYTLRLSIKGLVRKYFIVGLFMLLTLMPWTIRNYVIFGKFIPLSTLGGRVFWLGNNYLANGSSSGSYSENYIDIMKRTEGMTEYERDRIFFKEGVEELKKNPKRIPKLFIKKVMVHWAPFEEGFRVFNPYYAVILLFGSIGILFFRRHSVMENVLLIVFLTTTLTAIITVGDPRYRHPYESFLIIFAALAMNEIFNLISKRIKTRD